MSPPNMEGEGLMSPPNMEGRGLWVSLQPASRGLHRLLQWPSLQGVLVGVACHYPIPFRVTGHAPFFLMHRVTFTQILSNQLCMRPNNQSIMGH